MTLSATAKPVLLCEYHVANDEDFPLQVARVERIN